MFNLLLRCRQVDLIGEKEFEKWLKTCLGNHLTAFGWRAALIVLIEFVARILFGNSYQTITCPLFNLGNLTVDKFYPDS